MERLLFRECQTIVNLFSISVWKPHNAHWAAGEKEMKGQAILRMQTRFMSNITEPPILKRI